MAQLVAETYATALFEVVMEGADIATVYENYGDVIEVFNSMPEFYEIYNTPQIGVDEKKQIIDDVFKDKIDAVLLNFLKVLIDKRRTACVKAAYASFEEMVKEEQKLAKAVVTSVVPLSETQTEKLIEQLSKITNRKVTIENVIDESLVGGLFIRVGDHIIDSSVRHKLVELKDLLIERVV